MYINDAIRQADNYYSNEYSLLEKYLWCDEVSSMLAMEDRQCYNEKLVPVSSEGEITLPDGLSIEYIDKVLYKGRVLKKQDIRTFGKRTLSVKELGEFYENDDTEYDEGDVATVIYLMPYRPIRLVKYNGDIKINRSDNELCIKDCEFIAGDMLNLVDGDTVVCDVPVLDVVYSPESDYPYVIKCGGDKLGELVNDEFTGLINRAVMEKTVCDAPFDSMYIDYLLAKINMYQRDMTAYNQHMTSFNSRLGAYKCWITERFPKSDGRLVNFW